MTWLSSSALAQTPASSSSASLWPTTELTGTSLEPAAIKTGYLIDPSGKLDIIDVAPRKDFAALDPYQNFVLGHDGAAWLRLRLHIPLTNNNAQETRGSDLISWVLEIPAPLLDDVALYQIAEDGRLLPAQRAGDLLPNARWSYPSNRASFKLNLYAGDSADIWLRVKYPIVTQLPIFLKTEPQYLYDSRAYFWVIGVVFGALMFLCLYVAIIVATFKDLAHLGFGLYLASSLATLFAYSGVNGYLLFDHSARWTDASTGVWQLISATTAVFFVGTLLQAPARAPRLTLSMRVLGVLSLMAVPIYFFVDRASYGSSAVVLALISSYILCISMGVIAWRLGDKTGRIIIVFNALLLLNLIAALVGATGLVRFYWYQQTPVYILMVVLMPLILAEMNFKMRHQLTMQIRAQGMRSHDALTDALNEPFFLSRLRTIMNNPRKRKGGALVLIDVSNLPFMRDGFTQDIIEQTLLRAVIKIKKVFGDMDAIGRIGDHHLAVILENTDRDRLSKLAVELIASGLMPSKNLKQDVTIVFHFAITLLEEYEGHLDEILPSLQAVCSKMSPRTQRPIRYLQDAQRKAKSNGAQQTDGMSGFAPSDMHSQLDSPLSSNAASAVHSGKGHHAVHTGPAPLTAAPSTMPAGLHSSGHPSSGAPPSSSFHR
jgi:GGDEF domain-containing protein